MGLDVDISDPVLVQRYADARPFHTFHCPAGLSPLEVSSRPDVDCPKPAVDSDVRGPSGTTPNLEILLASDNLRGSLECSGIL
jgi:hypothetical protein